MRRVGTKASLLCGRSRWGWQPQLQRSLPAQAPQQYQIPFRLEAQ